MLNPSVPIPQLITWKKLLKAFPWSKHYISFKDFFPSVKLLGGYLKGSRLSEDEEQAEKSVCINEIHSFIGLCDNRLLKVSPRPPFQTLLEQGHFDTHVVLCESWYIGCYCLEPFEALLSSGALNHPTAHPIHCNHLKGILPAETTVMENGVKRSL